MRRPQARRANHRRGADADGVAEELAGVRSRERAVGGEENLHCRRVAGDAQIERSVVKAAPGAELDLLRLGSRRGEERARKDQADEEESQRLHGARCCLSRPAIGNADSI